MRKEVDKKPILHLYIETNGSGEKAEYVSEMVHQELTKLDNPYAELESFTGLKPLKVTLLPRGAFNEYKLKQQAAGAEMAHLSPPRINPSEGDVRILINAGAGVAEEAASKEKVEA